MCVNYFQLAIHKIAHPVVSIGDCQVHVMNFDGKFASIGWPSPTTSNMGCSMESSSGLFSHPQQTNF